MNGMNEENPNQQTPAGFCQNCGKSLTPETLRKVGPAVYCEPCLAAKLSGATPPPPKGAPADTVWQWGAGMPPGWTPGNAPNPGLAALLGLIPGVGAMYNEQYAKGIAHLVIFAMLDLLSSVNHFFGFFVLGWICYMSIEAHHTAKGRRDGTPLPNPFGLNDIGERMGFGKAWPAGPGADIAGAARDAAQAAAAGINAAVAGFSKTAPPAAPTPGQPAPAGPTPPAWGAPVDAYPPNPVYGSGSGPSYSQPYAQPYAQPYGAPVPPYSAPYTAVPPVTPPGVVPAVPPSANRFPVGAVLLIALGMLFLLGTMGIFNAIPGSALVGLVLLMLGIWIFLRRMTDSGLSLAYDGTPAYHFRVLRALRGAVWLIALGILSLLASFRLVSWEYSWPWLIILAGIMMLLQRAAYTSAVYAAQFTPPAPVSPSPSTSVEDASPEPDSHEGGN